MMFFTAVGLRFHDETRKAARIVYTLNIVFFYIRILEILSVNKYLGPYVKIIGKLVRTRLLLLLNTNQFLYCYSIKSCKNYAMVLLCLYNHYLTI